MKNLIFFISSVILLLFTFGCRKGEKGVEAPKANIEADMTAIKSSFQDWVKFYNFGDFDKVMSLYSEEKPIQMPPNESIRIGKEAILLGYKKTREASDETCESCVVEEVHLSGDSAVARGTDTGTSVPKNGGAPGRYNLKWLVVLERQTNGAWKWVYEIWNDNDPLPEMPERE